MSNIHEISPRLESELSDNKYIPVQEENYARVLHCVNPGDLIAAMGALKKYWEVTGLALS